MGTKHNENQNSVFFLFKTQIFWGCWSLTLFPSLSGSLSLFSFVWLVYINIKAFIQVQLLSNIAYIHLQLHPTLVRLSHPEPACGRYQTDAIIVFNTLGDTEYCLVVCGNISLWLSHTVAHRACMASFLSPEPQPGHCPACANCVCVCICVHLS